MNYDHSMATHTGLVPIDADYMDRETVMRRKRSLKHLLSKSSASRSRNDPSTFISPEFPPSVIASHAITTNSASAHAATGDEYADTVMRIRNFSVGSAQHYDTLNHSLNRSPSPSSALGVNGPDASFKNQHMHTRTASSDKIFAKHSRSRSTTAESYIPNNKYRRTPSAPRPAKDDDVARGVVEELHRHARNISTGSATNVQNGATPPKNASHVRNLSEGSAVPDSAAATGNGSRTRDSQNSTTTPRSQRMRNFSRPSSEHKRNLSADEPRRSLDRPPSRTAKYTTRPPVTTISPVNLRNKRSYDAVVHKKISQTYDTIPEGSTGPITQRPSTSHADARPKPTVTDDPSNDFLHPPKSRVQGRESSPENDQATWRPSKPENEVRDSMRSGWSAWSSTSTKHSSVFTGMSSVRDSTTTAEMSDNEVGKGMPATSERTHLQPYSINEEPRNSPLIRMSFLKGTDIDLRSSRIALAMEDTIGPDPPGTSRAIERAEEATAVSEAPVPVELSRPPKLLEPSSTHDQYGFQKTTRDVTSSAYDAWHKDYLKNQNRRTGRWVSMMKSAGLPTDDPVRFPVRSEKVQRFVRKGVPPRWRGSLWFYYAGGQAYVDRFPGLYPKLVSQSVEPQLQNSDKEAIDRDINRTFPDNIHFKPDPPLPDGEESPLLASLRRLLYAFAIHHPKIGYCQSLNFIAGMLLLFLDEEQAFWMMHIITGRYLPGTHEVSLEGANVDLWVLMLALREEQPRVWATIGGETTGEPTRLPPVSLCTTPWFMSLFIGTLPVESVLRMWDMLFYDGSTTIFRAALAIFRLGEAEILRVQDPMEIFQVVQTVPRRMLDASSLAMATNRKGSVSTTWIEQRRKEKKEFYAQERALEKVRKQSGEGGMPRILAPGADHPDMKMLTGAKSMGDLRRQRSKGVLVKRPPSRRK